MGAQERLLLGVLDAFGDHGHAERLAHAMIACAIAWSSESCGRSRTKERSILMVSIGNCFISDIDE